MSLATRCTHCGTIFKVVQDQLKVSEGWVRCGRCHEVFNALEGLFDLDREAPPARVPQEPPAMPAQQPAFEPPPAPPAPPAPVWSEPPTPEPPAAGLTQFDLDLPGGNRPFQAPAMPSTTASGSLPATHDAEPSAYPETQEADALESRYLLPREDGAPVRKRRRRGGPDFADAEFPEHLVDASDPWEDSLPAPEEAAAAPAHTTALPGDMRSVHHPSDVAPDEATTTGWPAAATVPAPSSTMQPPPAGMPSAPAPLDEDNFEPESALPPPSQRKGRPGTRGRAPQAEAPEFIRVAERKALWGHPTVVGLMAGLSVMLGLTLALQAAHHWRDTLAARQPALQPALQAMCSVLHCEIQAPMQLDDLQVDSVQLVRTASEGPDTYRLTAIVHNKADIALRWPQLDLTLTDPNGAVLVRRMFAVADAQVVPTDAPAAGRRGAPAEGQAVPPAVPPGTQTTVQWLIKAPNLRLAGYTAELFYP